MNVQRLQGIVFCVLALLATCGTQFIGRFSEQTELILLAALIVVLGIPHGALDTLFARRLYGIQTLWGWLGFSVVYLLLAGLVVGLWLVAPAGFLIGFLVISAVHFSGDPAAGTPQISRLLYAGTVLIFPSFFYGAEMSQLFSHLVGRDAAQAVSTGLGWLAWPWLVAICLAVLERLRRDWLTALEITAVSGLALLTPPLVAFTVFFCGMHSARHILRTAEYSGRSEIRLLAAAALLPMLGVVAASAGAWYFLQDTALDARVIQIVFVGLAALTVPHMALVERVRFSGWLKGAAK
jgi:beta-carotene 15,15'-dioxygenase